MNKKSMNEIVHDIINSIHDAFPDADSKENTFLRDVIIDPISNKFSEMYSDMYLIELAQSILTATDEDLDKLAANYFVIRKPATPSYGKIRFYIKNSDIDYEGQKFNDIIIAKGTIVSTIGNIYKPSISFQTIESMIVLAKDIINLPRDISGFRYIELQAISLETGSNNNIGTGEIVAQVGGKIDQIIMVSNPYPFTGGMDKEDDISLALRVSLAITGSNIGTLNGYLSYVMRQDVVMDAKVVGAGDPMMTRDNGQGGMVDIYIRTNTVDEDEYEIKISKEEIENSENGLPNNIILPKQPVNKINSIIGTIILPDKSIIQKSYINADDYEQEKGVDSNLVETVKYYNDIPWDFSIKTYFPDNKYYPLPKNLSTNEIARLKNKIDNQLLYAVNNDLIQNFVYNMNWSLITFDTNIIPELSLFDCGYYSDNQIYVLKIRQNDEDGLKLNNRVFVKKNDKIYIRVYTCPDFKLLRDSSDYGYSVQAKDTIVWLKNSNNIPEKEENLLIKYVWNESVKNIQDGIDKKRVITADVLVKEAKKLDVEIQLKIKCYSNYNPQTVKNKITNSIVNYIENLKKMGSTFDRSDIVHIVKYFEEVEYIDMDSVKISRVMEQPVNSITAKENEYLKIKNLVIYIIK